MQGGEVDVLAQRIRQPLVLDIGALNLTLQRADFWREQTREAQSLSLLRGESCSFVQHRRIKDGQPTSLGLMATIPVPLMLVYLRQCRDHSPSHVVTFSLLLRAAEHITNAFTGCGFLPHEALRLRPMPAIRISR